MDSPRMNSLIKFASWHIESKNSYNGGKVDASKSCWQKLFFFLHYNI